MKQPAGRHRKTLRALFSDPVRANIRWKDIENLLLALGAEVEEAEGSRICVFFNGRPNVFHRPHPGKEADRGVVRCVRRLLLEAGVRFQ